MIEWRGGIGSAPSALKVLHQWRFFVCRTVHAVSTRSLLMLFCGDSGVRSFLENAHLRNLVCELFFHLKVCKQLTDIANARRFAQCILNCFFFHSTSVSFLLPLSLFSFSSSPAHPSFCFFSPYPTSLMWHALCHAQCIVPIVILMLVSFCRLIDMLTFIVIINGMCVVMFFAFMPWTCRNDTTIHVSRLLPHTLPECRGMLETFNFHSKHR